MAQIAQHRPLGVALFECSGPSLQGSEPVGLTGTDSLVLPAEWALSGQLLNVSDPTASLRSPHEVEPALASACVTLSPSTGIQWVC